MLLPDPNQAHDKPTDRYYCTECLEPTVSVQFNLERSDEYPIEVLYKEVDDYYLNEVFGDVPEYTPEYQEEVPWESS